MVIYKITNLVNDKIYIGQKLHDSSDYLGSGKLIKRAIRKHGRENFTKDILEHCTSKEHLDEREKFWIKELNSRDSLIGYNISSGGIYGDCLSTHPDRDSIIRKIKHTLNNKTAEEKAVISAKISSKLKGLKKPPRKAAHTEKLRLTQLGRRHTDETRARFSMQRAGVPKTVKQIEGVRKANMKPVMIDGVTYCSVTEAAKSTVYTASQISSRCKSSNYQNFIMLSSHRKSHLKYGRFNSKPLVFRNTVFSSMNEACDITGLHCRRIYEELHDAENTSTFYI